MRGKAFWRSKRIAAPRITPAHAGKRICAAFPHASEEDHPRPCGEKTFRISAAYSSIGSPPPMRGKADFGGSTFDMCRITPAHAGKRSPADFFAVQLQDHPRPCGEKQRIRTLCTGGLGSPPPMRGKGRPAAQTDGIARITPAHAGKSSRAQHNL